MKTTNRKWTGGPGAARLQAWGAGVLALFLGTGAAAQVAPKSSLTLEGAKIVMQAAVEEALRDGGTGVIAIVDDGGQLLLLERLDGTFPAGATVSTGKARTAALFQKPTRVFEEIIGKGRTAMAALEDFTPLQGGIPLMVDGKVVGGIGVSGAASAARDEEVALAGARATEGFLVPASLEERCCKDVTFLPARTVATAFQKGMPLVEVAGYKVHASHRDGAGQAEVHAADTDILYVLQGRAILTTGGTVVGGKEVAPEEVRGTSIEGGTDQPLAPGDVMIVPHGVPHWFREVQGPFDYYVVKVRG